MQYSFTALAVAALVTLSVAQSTVPPCVQKCIDASTAKVTTCTVGDIACACKTENQNKILADTTPCALACGTADAIAGQQAVAAICAALATAKPTTAAPPPSTSAPPPAQSSTAAPPAESSTAAPHTDSSAASSSAAPSASASASGSSAPVVTVHSTASVDCSCTKTAKHSPTTAPVATNGTHATTTASATGPLFTGAASAVQAGLGSVFALGVAALVAL